MIKRFLFKIRLAITSAKRKPYLYRKLGVCIGDGCRFEGVAEFGSEPYLVRIGDNVLMSSGVTFLTHDGGVHVFRSEFPNMNVYAPIVVGNNVMIGTKAILMPGVSIGNNVVIGAGSIVTKNIPSNCVVAGVPARLVRNLEDYKQKALSNAVFIDSSNQKELRQFLLQRFPT